MKKLADKTLPLKDKETNLKSRMKNVDSVD